MGPLLGTSGTASHEWVNGADTTAEHSIVIVGTTDGTINGQNSAFLMKKDQNYYSPSYTEELDLAISQNTSSKFSVYPNPVLSQIHLSNNKNISTLFIYDINWKLLMTINPTGNSVNLEKLKSGIYFIKTNLSNAISLKFIKL